MNSENIRQLAGLLPEKERPAGSALMEAGSAAARECIAGRGLFLRHFDVPSEAEYKRRRISEGAIMQHAQIGYRDLEKTRRAWADIHRRLDNTGGRIDRYGICLDWSMGYPAAERKGRPKGTGLILQGEDEFRQLTDMAPVAPHFGDFVIGMPSALENTTAALQAGATAIGNLGQYFTFRLPGWDDDITTTAATVKALALCAAQPVEIIIHSNLDDGFAAMFNDLSSAFGMALLERYLVEELIGGRIAHCYGHTFSDPVTRLAFQRALTQMPSRHATPGSMIYGNTVAYQGDGNDNYAAAASYLLTDLAGQRLCPSGHALNPVPVTEARRIPDIDEVIDAQIFLHRLVERGSDLVGLITPAPADAIADRIIEGGRAFYHSALKGLQEAGIDIRDPFALMLALRRAGARRLEDMFGAGSRGNGPRPRRRPLVKATTLTALESQARTARATLTVQQRQSIGAANITICLGATDVHEYGKILVAEILEGLNVTVLDMGVHAEPEKIAGAAADSNADFIAVSTYNGIALGYLEQLQSEMHAAGIDCPLLIGGRLNQLDDGSNSGLPADVGDELTRRGALVCRDIVDLFPPLLAFAAEKSSRPA